MFSENFRTIPPIRQKLWGVSWQHLLCTMLLSYIVLYWNSKVRYYSQLPFGWRKWLQTWTQWRYTWTKCFLKIWWKSDDVTSRDGICRLCRVFCRNLPGFSSITSRKCNIIAWNFVTISACLFYTASENFSSIPPLQQKLWRVRWGYPYTCPYVFLYNPILKPEIRNYP